MKRKSMGDSEHIMERHNNGEELSVDEARLVDLMVLHKTGKRTPMFEEQPKKKIKDKRSDTGHLPSTLIMPSTIELGAGGIKQNASTQ